MVGNFGKGVRRDFDFSKGNKMGVWEVHLKRDYVSCNIKQNIAQKALFFFEISLKEFCV